MYPFIYIETGKNTSLLQGNLFHVNSNKVSLFKYSTRKNVNIIFNYTTKLYQIICVKY